MILLLNKNFSRTLFSADNLFVVCLALFPIFSLSLHRWISAFLFVAFCISSYILIRDRQQEAGYFSDHASSAWIVALAAALGGPVVAIFLGQVFRQELIPAGYDNASRFLFAIPIALVVLKNRINVFRLLEYAIPASIFATALSAFINPGRTFGSERLTTYFVDPLTFGSICLTLALISLASIDFHRRDTWQVRLFKLSAFTLGLYLSFMSGSRTGWLAIPVVLWLWLRYKRDIPHWIIFGLVTVFCIGIYFFMPVVSDRVDIGVHELLNYRWNNPNPDGSIEMRISFFRIGLFVFAQSPLGGWGDTGFGHLLNAPELQRFATEYTRHFAFRAGFHNEIVTNMVRSGIWGLLSSAALFLVPLVCCVKGLRSESTLVRNHALIVISYLMGVFVSAMSTEVFNLKFTASFHALMIASLTASLLILISSEKNLKNL